MKVYIAGPMTGIADFNYPAFNKAAAELRALGYEVENPAENTPPPCKSWAAYMRIALTQMLKCDMVVLLDGWQESRGARLEEHIADSLGINTFQIDSVIKAGPIKK